MNALKKRNITSIAGCLIIGLVLLGIEALIYGLSAILAEALGIKPLIMTGSVLDDMIPACPHFIIPYGWAYIYWVTTPVTLLKCGKPHLANVVVTYLLALFLCGILLTLLPTQMDRIAEGLYDTDKVGFFWDLLHFCYLTDGKYTASCLIPSLHCFNTTFFHLSACTQPNTSRGYKIYSWISLVLISVSTLFTKQHYLIDVVTGIALATLLYYGLMRFQLGSRLVATLQRRMSSHIRNQIL